MELNKEDIRKELYEFGCGYMLDEYMELFNKIGKIYHKKQLSIHDVSGSISVEDTVNAFLDWMKSDDCLINDKDGNRIPDAKIDGKNFMKYAEKYYR